MKFGMVLLKGDVGHHVCIEIKMTGSLWRWGAFF